MHVTTDSGREVQCRKVLLASGAYTDFRSLLPNIKVDQTLCPLTVALAEISESDALKMK